MALQIDEELVEHFGPDNGRNGARAISVNRSDLVGNLYANRLREHESAI